MRAPTVVISLVFHIGLAGFLLSRAETRQRRKSISVAVQDEKKKEDKPKPVPPKQIAKAVAKPPPPPPKEEAPTPEPAKAAPSSAPTETAVALSNADLAPGGIALAGTPKAEAIAPQAKAVKVAQAVPDDVRKKLNDASGKPVEADCEEEPTKPEPEFKTEIEYTASAREQGIEGRMKLKITVGADGSVTDVEVETGLDPSLDAAAVAAVKQWRFKPALRCGKPVAGGVYRVAQRFELAN